MELRFFFVPAYEGMVLRCGPCDTYRLCIFRWCTRGYLVENRDTKDLNFGRVLAYTVDSVTLRNQFDMTVSGYFGVYTIVEMTRKARNSLGMKRQL